MPGSTAPDGPVPTERRLAAIMFTDIVGYTALMAESEEKGHRVRERQGEVLRPLVEQYGGEWVAPPPKMRLLSGVDAGSAAGALCLRSVVTNAGSASKVVACELAPEHRLLRGQGEGP